MARLLGNFCSLEVRAVIRFSWAKNASTSAMSRQHVAKLCHTFQSGRHDVKSCHMTESGRPSSSTTGIPTARIGEMVQKDLREISSELGLIYGSVQDMFSDVPRQCHKIIRRDLAQWTGI
ncbi:hypothetical protein TNCV_2996761 [Trichonephila clavipes]|nr:hypothetical protein TNCV_2996761 [Trichonephila clavipes]